MSDETAAAPDTSTGVTPAARWRIKAMTVLPAYRLAVTFNDGREGIVDFSGVTNARNSGIYSTLADPRYFEQALLVLGAVTWPSGADLDPMWMYEMLAEEKSWVVPF